MNGRATCWIGAALALLGGCSREAPESATAVSAEVDTVTVRLGDVSQWVLGYGVIDIPPQSQWTVPAEVESRIESLAVVPGSTVRRGDVLVRLVPTATSMLELGRAGRESAVAANEAQRVARLRAEGLATDSERWSADSAAATAKDVHDSLTRRLGAHGRAEVRASADAIVQSISVHPGDQVSAGDPLLTLGDRRHRQAILGLSPADATAVRAGAVANIGFDPTGYPLSGTVQMTEARLDPDSRTVSVRVALATDSVLLPGTSVLGRIRIGHRTGVPVVPVSALVHDDGGTAVFVVQSGKAVRQSVTVGIDDGAQVEVIHGLEAGAVVITTGRHEVRDGMVVRVKVAADGHEP